MLRKPAGEYWSCRWSLLAGGTHGCSKGIRLSKIRITWKAKGSLQAAWEEFALGWERVREAIYSKLLKAHGLSGASMVHSG